MDEKPVLSVILPCLNEEAGLEFCLPRIKSVLAKINVPAEVIVVDNGSTDRSAEIAMKNGARVVQEPVAGYGAACMKGFETARGEFCFLADADGTYDFEEIPNFLAAFSQGWDFILGNRFKGRSTREPCPGHTSTSAIRFFLPSCGYSSRPRSTTPIAACAQSPKRLISACPS